MKLNETSRCRATWKRFPRRFSSRSECGLHQQQLVRERRIREFHERASRGEAERRFCLFGETQRAAIPISANRFLSMREREERVA